MELKNFFAQDDAGNILSAATCYLYMRGTENLAAGLVKANGTNLSNPFVTGADGLAQLAAPNGLYDLRVVKGARDYRLQLQFNDVNETVALAQAAAGRAELARDVAQLSSGIYLNTALGLAATASGRYFSVPSDSSSEYLILYLNSSGVAVEKKRYPSAESVASIRAQWLAADAESSTAVTQILDAISTLRIKGGNKARTYRINVFSKNDATYADRIQVVDDLGNTWAFLGTAAGKDDGPVSVVLAGAAGTSFVMIVDYRKITSNGVIFNSVSSMALKFGARIFAISDVEAGMEANAAAISATAAGLEDTKGLLSKGWRAVDAIAPNATEKEIISAISTVRVRGGNKARTYRIAVLAKDDVTFADRLQINDDLGASWAFSGVATGKADGPVVLNLVSTPAGAISFVVVIDYRKITGTGLKFNSTTSQALKLSPSIFSVADVEDGLTATNASLATLDAKQQKGWRDTTSIALTNPLHLDVQAAVLAVRAKGGDPTKAYRLTLLCKDDASLKDRLFIQDTPATTTWSVEGTVAGKADGPVWVKAIKAGSAISFDLLIDYRKISTTGIVLNTTGEQFKLSAQVLEWDRLRAEFPVASNNATALARAIRVSVAGSSITWGQGWLGEDSYVGDIERYLRTTLATTLHGADFAITGTSATVSNKLFYKGAALRLQELNTEARFDLYGDELSLCIARERGNAGASLVEVYADGVLLDTFSTWNSEPFAPGLTAPFTGDGVTRQFDLGQAFTFGHGVTVAGAAKVVQMNTGGYGAGFPGGVDVLVIRKLITVGGVPQVRHFLWFAVAPANGAAIVANYSAGESVTYVRGTLGQTAQALTGTNESTYGDGNVAFDPANPANLSSGLGFRETDERAVLSWRFSSAAKRSFRVKILSLDPRATGTPQLYLNAATNRMHHLQNAGIGGWKASLLLNDTGLNNLAAVQRFQPDVLLFESCTNDDWDTHLDRAWRSRTGLTDAQLRSEESAAWLHAVTYVGPDNYSVDDNRVAITAISETSVSFDGAGATFEVVAGDVVILGDFKGDNRRLACRVVKSWNAGTRTATWARPLRATELAHIRQLADLVGSTAMVKGAPVWVSNVEAVIDGVRAALPSCVVAIGTGGIPNIRYRRLEGYRELAAEIAGRKGVLFADFYKRTLAWQYSQPATSALYLNASQSLASTGAASYSLYDAGGSKPDPVTNQLFRGWSVKVDGVERINVGCHILGGNKTGWAVGITPMTKSNASTVGDEYQLVFTANVPAPGAVIVVKRATDKWASDDTHPGTSGIAVFGQAAIAAVSQAARLAEASPGAKF